MKIQRAGTMEKPEVSPDYFCTHVCPNEFISPHAQFRKYVERVFSRMTNDRVRFIYVWLKKFKISNFKFCSEYTSIYV